MAMSGTSARHLHYSTTYQSTVWLFRRASSLFPKYMPPHSRFARTAVIIGQTAVNVLECGFGTALMGTTTLLAAAFLYNGKSYMLRFIHPNFDNGEPDQNRTSDAITHADERANSLFDAAMAVLSLGVACGLPVLTTRLLHSAMFATTRT